MSDANNSKKKQKVPDPDGTERYERNQTLRSQRDREINMWAVLKFQMENNIAKIEKLCASAEYLADYKFHTKGWTEIANLKCILAQHEREYRIKRLAFDVALRELDFGKYEGDREVVGWSTEHYWDYMGRHGEEIEIIGLPAPVHL